MALVPIIKPTYPNVPDADGVPPLLRSVAGIQNNIALLAGDALSILALFDTPQWGLFTADGAPAFAGPTSAGLARVLEILGPGGLSVGEIEYRQEFRLSSAPQEAGAFLSYNKVNSPFQGRVSYIIGGTAAQRGAFLGIIEKVEASLDLLSLVTPEKTYPSVTVVHHDYRRSAHAGVSMFVVDVWIEEVRITGTSAFTTTTAPAGASPANVGAVQPGVPTAAQSAAVPGGAPT